MKTTLLRSSLGILVSGACVAAAWAGPGPQFWKGSSPAPGKAPAAKTHATAAAKCEGCKTTPIWVVSDRGPAGKGLPGARIVGSTHSCARCTGTIATQNGTAKDGMTHHVACGPLLCCK